METLLFVPVEFAIMLVIHVGAVVMWRFFKNFPKELIPLLNIFFGITGLMTWHPYVTHTNWILLMFHGVILGTAVTGIHTTYTRLKRYIKYKKLMKIRQDKRDHNQIDITKTLKEGGEE